MSLTLVEGLICMEPFLGEPDATFALVGHISRPDIEPLCERARGLLVSAPRVLVCDVGALVDPDVASVDAIARLQLMARESGRELRLRNACSELLELLDLAGLTDVITTSAD